MALVSKTTISAVSKVSPKASTESVALLIDLGAKVANPWQITRRTAPNAAKLRDGAIQRMAVSPSRFALHPKVNQAKVGFYKQDELTERASRRGYLRSCPYDYEDDSYITRVVRITLDEKCRTQMHP